MFGTSPYDSVPYTAIASIATAFAWLMMVKYKALRNIPDMTTKKEGRIYGIIGISFILLFLLLIITLPLIVK